MLEHCEEGLQEPFEILQTHPLVAAMAVQEWGRVQREI